MLDRLLRDGADPWPQPSGVGETNGQSIRAIDTKPPTYRELLDRMLNEGANS